MQRIDAIKAISRNLKDLIVDASPVSLTGSSIMANELIHPDARQLQGKNFYIYSGAAAGQERIAGSLNPTKRELIFTQVFGSVPSLNSNFILTDYFKKSEYDNALDRYIGIAKIKFLEDKVATLSLVATQYEYTVPSGFEWVSGLRLVPSSNTDYGDSDKVYRLFEIPPRDFRIERNALGSYMIVIDSRKVNLDYYDNHWINVMGQVKPDISATDNATITSDLEEFIVTGASMLLASQRINENREWLTKFYMFRDNLRPLEDYIYRYGRGRKVK